MIHNFSWLLPGRLAGFGLQRALSIAGLSALRAEGVGGLVSLTEDSLDPGTLSDAAIRYLHLPVPDMQAPSQEQLECFVRFVDSAGELGLATAVHCRAGLGRTGTMLAAYLIRQGVPFGRALAQVRERRPGSVETLDQEDALCQFARSRGVPAPWRA